jgi:tetratricopeptide (TPR) repeat protein
VRIAIALIAFRLLAQDFTALSSQANEARDANRPEEAIGLYRKALRLRPEWAEGWWSIGTLLYDRDDYSDAAGALQKAAELSPKSGVALVMLGLCEAKLGRNQDALRHIGAGRNLGIGDNPGLRPVMLYTEGTLLVAAGEFGAAQSTLGLLAREGVDSEELIVGLGQAVLGIRNLSPDDTATREIVRRAGWAEHCAARGEFAAAMREYGGLAADAPKFHNVQFAYGRFLLANHEDGKAVEAFQREIANRPNHLLARLGIAGIYIVTDPAAGLPYAEEAVKLAPRLAEAHYLLGMILLGTGKTARAIQELETARTGEPEQAKIYFALSRAYAAANRREDAARARAAFGRLNKQTGQ